MKKDTIKTYYTIMNEKGEFYSHTSYIMGEFFAKWLKTKIKIYLTRESAIKALHSIEDNAFESGTVVEIKISEVEEK